MERFEQLDGYSGEEAVKDKIYEALNVRKDKSLPEYDEEFSRNVALLLLGMGMEKYIELFQSENVGKDALTAITADDLRAIGVTDDADIADIQGKFNCMQSVDIQEVELHPSDDAAIIKSLVEQTNKLGVVFFKLAVKLQKSKAKVVDNLLSPNYSQLQVLNVILDQVIAQTETNLRLMYADNKVGLVYDILEKEKLTLPKFLEKKLSSKKKLKKSAVMVLTISILSLGVALLRFIM